MECAAFIWMEIHSPFLFPVCQFVEVILEYNGIFRSHIDKTVKKVNSTLGFLRNQDTKTVAYKTLVRPTIEYCSSVWSPHTKDAIKCAL
jgi:hypothetical protein